MCAGATQLGRLKDPIARFTYENPAPPSPATGYDRLMATHIRQPIHGTPIITMKSQRPYFVFQKQRYEWDPEREEFRKVAAPVNEHLSFYLNSKPYQSRKEVRAFGRACGWLQFAFCKLSWRAHIHHCARHALRVFREFWTDRGNGVMLRPAACTDRATCLSIRWRRPPRLTPANGIHRQAIMPECTLGGTGSALNFPFLYRNVYTHTGGGGHGALWREQVRHPPAVLWRHVPGTDHSTLLRLPNLLRRGMLMLMGVWSLSQV